MSTQRQVVGRFRERGLSVQADACTGLVALLDEDPLNASANLTLVLEAIDALVEKKELVSAVVTLETITAVIAEATSNSEDLVTESMQLADAFSAPRLEYDEQTKAYRFVRNASTEACGVVCGDMDARTNMFRRRVLMARDRLVRSGKFKLRGERGVSQRQSSSSSNVYEICNVQDLLGATGTKVLLGVLTQPKDGQWCIEDLTAVLPLDLREARSYSPYTEGAVVLLIGDLVSAGLFRVTQLAFPPAEERNATLNAIGYHDVFGTKQQQLQSMCELESRAVGEMIVFAADLQLDRPLSQERLNQLFAGFERLSVAPTFVLLGSFVSTQGARRLHTSVAAFTLLADTIAAYPLLATSARFVIVPGPDDVGDCVALPRRALPLKLQSILKKRVNRVTFGSNPCRLRFYTQELVLFRENLVQKMHRHGAGGEGGEGEVGERVAAAVLDQAHLCPLPLHARPVLWALDHALHLTPLPHLVLLADSSAEAFECERSGCVVANPGSFARDASFLVYRPALKELEITHLV